MFKVGMTVVSAKDVIYEDDWQELAVDCVRKTHVITTRKAFFAMSTMVA